MPMELWPDTQGGMSGPECSRGRGEGECPRECETATRELCASDNRPCHRNTGDESATATTASSSLRNNDNKHIC